MLLKERYIPAPILQQALRRVCRAEYLRAKNVPQQLGSAYVRDEQEGP